MTTLSGKPSMPCAWSAQVHGKVQPMRKTRADYPQPMRFLTDTKPGFWARVFGRG